MYFPAEIPGVKPFADNERETVGANQSQDKVCCKVEQYQGDIWSVETQLSWLYHKQEVPR